MVAETLNTIYTKNFDRKYFDGLETSDKKEYKNQDVWKILN